MQDSNPQGGLIHSEHNVAPTRAAWTTKLMFLIVLIRVIKGFVQYRGLLCNCCLLAWRRQNFRYIAQVNNLPIAEPINPLGFKLYRPVKSVNHQSRSKAARVLGTHY